MTIPNEVKNFLNSITEMVSKSNEEIVSVSAKIADPLSGVNRTVVYSVQNGLASDETEVVSKIDIYKRLWQCRDFEIDLVWKRATFMTAFLLGCFVGYGSIISKLIQENGALSTNPKLHALAACVAAVGFCIAVLWVALARGSKAWYEVYEEAIVAFGRAYCHDSIWAKIVGASWRCIPTTAHTAEPKFLGAGWYSVSKVNILIGWLFAFVWFMVLACHVLIVMNWLDWIKGHAAGVLIAVSVVLFVMAFVSYFGFARSSTLKKKFPDCDGCTEKGRCDSGWKR